MNSRTIVTSQPDIACDVCERRLLRGEQSEIFLAAGQPRTVCELCAPRAAHQGWKRASDMDAVGVAVARPRRARGIIDRFSAAGRSHWLESDRELPHGEGADGAAHEPPPERLGAHDARGTREDDLGAELAAALGEAGTADAEAGPLAQALEIFNATEYPRRVGGVARSLGPPEVNVHELDVSGVVAIVVAWELCWYRYRVDVDDPANGAQLVAQGAELSELAREEHEVNATADERGALHLHALA